MRIEVPTDTPTEFKLGDTAADIQRRREDKERGGGGRETTEGGSQRRNSTVTDRRQWPKKEQEQSNESEMALPQPHLLCSLLLSCFQAGVAAFLPSSGACFPDRW